MVLLLEIARGIAALWVFFFHTANNFKDSSEFIYNLAMYGHFGVPMFFVISGFVITYSAESTLQANKNPISFLKKRLLRIYPVFWISIILVILLPYIIEFISMFKSGSFQSPESLIPAYNLNEWVNFILLSKVFFAETNSLQVEFNAINAVYWTIAIEVQFYLVIFISMFAKRYYKYIIFLVSLAAIGNMINPLGFSYGLFIYYWPSFSIGILLAYIFKSRYDLSTLILPKYRLASSITILLTTLILIRIFVESKIGDFTFACVFGILLWSISPLETKLVNIKTHTKSLRYWILEAAVVLGAMSYSVYLVHGKLNFLSEMFVRQIISPDSIFYGLLTIFLTLLLCYPFYVYFERPFMSNSYIKLHKKALGT